MSCLNPLSEDGTLVASILSDPEHGWKEFTDRHEGFIKALIRRFHLLPEDQKEVLQEVHYRLVKDDLKVLRGWDPARCPLRGYLAVVTHSVCLSFCRSTFHSFTMKKAADLDDENRLHATLQLLGQPAPSPAERMLRLEIPMVLKRCLDSCVEDGVLSSEDQLLIDLRLGGMSWNQVADTLGITSIAARMRMHRAKEVVREWLESDGFTLSPFL